jgi:hypothetical protein
MAQFGVTTAMVSFGALRLHGGTGRRILGRPALSLESTARNSQH